MSFLWISQLFMLIIFNCFLFKSVQCVGVDYCEVEKLFCNKNNFTTIKHVACPFNNFISVDVLEDITPAINFIINWINTFRNDLAFGRIPNHPKSSNMHIVSWNRELQMLAEKRNLYADLNACYSTEDGTKTKYHIFNGVSTENITTFMEQTLNNFRDEKKKMSWSFLYNSLATKIGCSYSYANDTNYYNIECYTNEIEYKDYNDAYLAGQPCTHCENSTNCDDFYKGLCVVPGDKFDPANKEGTTHKIINSNNNDTNTTFILIHLCYIILILILIIISIGYIIYIKRHRVYVTPNSNYKFSNNVEDDD